MADKDAAPLKSMPSGVAVGGGDAAPLQCTPDSVDVALLLMGGGVLGCVELD